MLSATIDSFTKKHYAFLGKLLTQKEPTIAQRLISDYLPEELPLEDNLEKMNAFFITFCKIQDLEPSEYTGALYKRKKVEVRKLFISCMLHLYNPQVYLQPSDNLTLSSKFVVQLSDTLGQDKGNISKMIREVILWEKSYEDFALSVEQTTEKILHTAG